jgi:hypothetical protein
MEKNTKAHLQLEIRKAANEPCLIYPLKSSGFYLFLYWQILLMVYFNPNLYPWIRIKKQYYKNGKNVDYVGLK